MTPARFKDIRRVFQSIIELDPSARDAALRTAAQNDQTLLQEVKQLIAAHDRPDAFIDQPAANLKLLVSSQEGQADLAGRLIGPYQLQERIGQGGMGEVWRAEQQFPVRRQAAIKLIKTGMDTREVVARFESERQALALMDHPAIAKVFDAGSTPEGKPYFAMEYVSGVPVTAYCDEHKLTTRRRLELMIRVCEGVQHAHQKAIIHRDLKPSNILVTEVDGKPVPKIIDFGVAKAISQSLTNETSFTRAGVIIGTPDYMSPEQASTGIGDIDTRTDVYSLGVILYELLSGSLPFDSRKLPIDEVLRNVRYSDAPAPSTRIRAHDNQTTVSGNRGTDPYSLIQLLRGDLDAITLKALEKHRSRRYESPSDLAADIRRYLRSEPVTARLASASYQISKYIRRHLAGVFVAATFVLLLGAFGVAEAVQLERITRERDRADRITNFMTSMFRVSDPSESKGNKVTAREILDKASVSARSGLEKDPEMEAQMMNVIGNVYYNLGLYSQAEPLLTEALRTRRKIFGTDNAKTAQSISELGNILNRLGRREESTKLDQEALDIRRRVLGPSHPDTLKSMNNVATSLAEAGRLPEAEKLHREVFKLRSSLLGAENPATLMSMGNLGSTLNDEGHFAEAESLERRAVEIKRRVLGPDHPETLRSLHHLVTTLYDEGQYGEAETLGRDVLRTYKRILGPEHSETLDSAISLANVLEGEGKYSETAKLIRSTLEIQRRVLGAEHSHTLLTQSNLAEVLGEEGHYDEAVKMHREVVSIRAKILGPEHPRTLYSRSKLALVLTLQGHFDEAEKLARETREVQVRVLGEDHPDTADSTCTLASLAAYQRRTLEAFSLLRDSIDHGLKPGEALGIEADRRFAPLRGDKRFTELIAYARRHSATVGQR